MKVEVMGARSGRAAREAVCFGVTRSYKPSETSMWHLVCGRIEATLGSRHLLGTERECSHVLRAISSRKKRPPPEWFLWL